MARRNIPNRAKKIATAKALTRKGESTRTIAKRLRVSSMTVLRWTWPPAKERAWRKKHNASQRRRYAAKRSSRRTRRTRRAAGRG